jgi:calcineurin-like phosphoesterase family protein
MHRIFITADWHFFHKGINVSTSSWTRAKPSRNFPTLDDMHDCIIDNINAVVNRGDTLINLGDVIFGNVAQLPTLVNRIVCNDIRLILGNHDKAIKPHRINDKGKRVPNGKLGECFSDVRERGRVKHGEHRVYLLHEPMHTWPAINKGAIQLHGHCHGNLPDRGLRQMDVGVDANDMKPWLLDDIIDLMTKRNFEYCPDIPQDHHTS